MKRMIVNADDFGITDGVNRGILRCYQEGIVTSTTLMVNGIAAASAAELAVGNPGLGVGLHINLTSGTPTLPPQEVSSLLDREGGFAGKANMLARLTSGTARKAELEAEIRAQVNKCRRLGVEPTHVDSHHHLHAHPVLAASVSRVCRSEGIFKARGYRLAPRSLKAAAIRLAAGLPWPGGTTRMVTPDRFAGIEEMGRNDMVAMLAKELEDGVGTIEFMCHPGYADDQLRKTTSYNDLREVELTTLLSGRARDVVDDAGVTLISFADL